MSGRLRAALILAVVAISTIGEGGASADSLLAVHLLLAAGVALFVFLVPEAPFVPDRSPSIAWLLFALVAAVSAAAAPYAYAAWLVLIEIAAFGSLVWLTCGEPDAVGAWLGPGVAALGAVHGTLAIAARVTGEQRPAGSFLNPNHLGAWLAAATLLLLGELTGTRPSMRRLIGSGGAIALALGGIFVTGSRGTLVGLLAGITVLVALSAGRLTARARRAMLAAAFLVVVAGGLGAVVRSRSETDPYRFHRTRIWAAALSGTAGTRGLGVGPGQFAALAANMNFPLEDEPLRFGRSFVSPHSDLLRSICEFGIPATLAAFAAALLLAARTVVRRSRLTGLERGAFAALAALAAQGLVDDLSRRPGLTTIAAVLVGLLLARRRIGSPLFASRIAASVLAALLVLALSAGEIAGYAAWRAARGVPEGKLDAVELSRLQRSIRWNPMRPAGWLRLAEHHLGDGRSWDLPDYAAAREAVEHARRLQPVDAVFARAEARIEAAACLSLLPFQSTRDRAVRMYHEASALARTDATIPLEASRFLLQAGDPAGARREAAAALAIEPKAATPRLCLARAVHEQSPEAGTTEARRWLAEAKDLALAPGSVPSSSYEAALRRLDSEAVARLMRDLGETER